MLEFWNKQIVRADYLAAETSGSKELLTFYAQLLRVQEEIYDFSILLFTASSLGRTLKPDPYNKSFRLLTGGGANVDQSVR